METLIINIPDKKSAFVKKLLKELGVTIEKQERKSGKNTVPNDLTLKAMMGAGNRVDLGGPITDIKAFLNEI